jgi:hypothetical protein
MTHWERGEEGLHMLLSASHNRTIGDMSGSRTAVRDAPVAPEAQAGVGAGLAGQQHRDYAPHHHGRGTHGAWGSGWGGRAGIPVKGTREATDFKREGVSPKFKARRATENTLRHGS